MEHRRAEQLPVGRRELAAFLLACLLFAAPKLPVYLAYNYTFDDVYHMARAMDALAEPGLFVAPDYTARAHPLFLGVLAASVKLFGLGALAPGLLLLVSHALAAAVLGALAAQIGGGAGGTRLVTSLSFLFFAAPNRLFGDVAHVSRTLGVCLALMALASLLRFLRSGAASAAIGYVGLSVASVVCFEDTLATPLLGLLLARVAGGSRRGELALHGAAALSAGGLLWCLSASSAGQYGLRIGAHSLVKLAALPAELLQDLVVPHADFLGRSAWGTAGRLGVALALCLAAGAAAYPVRRALGRALAAEPCLLGVAWLILTALPYTLRATGTVWHSRYLYLPGAGLALILGGLAPALAQLAPLRRRLLLATAVAILALNVLTMEHMVRKVQAEWAGVVAPERFAVAFEVARALNRLELHPGARLRLADVPLAPAELASVCDRYVLGKPTCSADDAKAAGWRWIGGQLVPSALVPLGGDG